VPAGATPKEGPSAGVALATSLVSALTGLPVRKDVAMTGEITLRGRVLPIGGLKEKILGAKRAGIKHIVYPSKNAADMKDVAGHLTRALHMHEADDLDAVLDVALVGGMEALEARAKGGAAPGGAGPAEEKKPAGRKRTPSRKRPKEAPDIRA